MPSLGLNYIGVVKSATRKFTHGKLSTVVLPYRGDSISYIHTTDSGTVKVKINVLSLKHDMD